MSCPGVAWKRNLSERRKMTDQLKQLAQQTIDVIDHEKVAPEMRLKILKSYMLGLIDGISITKDPELDTCTMCGKKTGEASYVVGHRGLYCPECSAELCGEQENDRGCPYGHVMGRDFHDYADCAKCAGATYFKCEAKKEKEQKNNGRPEKTPRIKEIPHPNRTPKCSICCNEGELTSILTHNGRIFKVCERCRKALEDPKVQEALHKG